MSSRRIAVLPRVHPLVEVLNTGPHKPNALRLPKPRAEEVRRYPTEVGPAGCRHAALVRLQIPGAGVLAVVAFNILSRSTAR